jgi:hypothetical protein
MFVRFSARLLQGAGRDAPWLGYFFAQLSRLVNRLKRTHEVYSAPGKVNRNTAPRGSFASAHSRPPWASMINRQIPVGSRFPRIPSSQRNSLLDR